MVELEGGSYLGPILSTSLAKLLARRRSEDDGATRGGGGGGGGGSGSGGGSSYRKLAPKVGATGGLHKCGHAMKGTFPPCPFGMGIICGPF